MRQLVQSRYLDSLDSRPSPRPSQQWIDDEVDEHRRRGSGVARREMQRQDTN